MLIVSVICFASCLKNSSESIDGERQIKGISEISTKTRGFKMGFSALPKNPSWESYQDTFEIAAAYGEVIAIKRTPPWEEFMSGSTISQETKDLAILEKELINRHNLTLVFAIDPWDGAVQRTRIHQLPMNYDPRKGISDKRLQTALTNYAIFVTTNYEPDYLILGIEINMLAERSPQQFAAFLDIYAKIYEDIKKIRPEIKIFPTFQIEDLYGLLDVQGNRSWESIDVFSGMMDMLAVSTFPYLTDIDSAQSLNTDYYLFLRERFKGEIMIFEAAYPSKAVDSYPLIGNENDQNTYIKKLLNDAETGAFSVLIWLALSDPFTTNNGGPQIFRDIGLIKKTGEYKQAWHTWETWVNRSYISGN